jgi:hypothetical protein
VVALAKEATDRFYDRLSISGDMLLGKTKFDIKDEVIRQMIELRRNPPTPPSQTTAADGAKPQLPTGIRVPGRVRPTSR